jgi:hypothetical protein
MEGKKQLIIGPGVKKLKIVRKIRHRRGHRRIILKRWW